MKTILLLSIVFIMNNSFGQSTQISMLAKTDYLQKSKEQKRTGLILIASGTIIATIGILKNVNSPRFLGTINKEEKFWTWASLAGIISDVIGIRFLIDSHKNKIKGNNLSFSFSTQPLMLQQQTNFVIAAYSMVTLKINIGD